MKCEVLINGARRTVEFDLPKELVLIDGRKIDADVVPTSSGMYSVLLGARSYEVTVEKSGDGWVLRTGGLEFRTEIVDPRSWHRNRGARLEVEGRQQIVTPMPGKVIRVLVTVGQKIYVGQSLLVIEAMKMQNEIRSPKSGTIERIAIEGETVIAGEILAVVV